MKRFEYTVPNSDYVPKRACMLNYKGIEICKLIECVNMFEGDKGYTFVPDYEAMDKALAIGMVDIPGIDHTLRLPQYNRFGIFPAFLVFRYIPIDRPDWVWRYKKVGLNHQDQWEFMVRMKGACREDSIRVERCDI